MARLGIADSRLCRPRATRVQRVARFCKSFPHHILRNLTEEIVIKGVAASPGVAIGSASILIKSELDIPQHEVGPEQREEEIARFEASLLETRRQISEIRAEVAEKVGESEAGIFDAHQLVLEDRALIEEAVREVVEGGYNIEYSFNEVANRYIQAFSQIEDEYIKERVADIKDVTRRLLANLIGRQDVVVDATRARGIIVADDLSPSDASQLDRETLKAIATDHGSRNSHTVIMARSMGVPCVIGLKDLTERIQPEDVVLVDGYDGLVILNPTEASRFRYGELQAERDRVKKRYTESKFEPAATSDGIEYQIMLNVEGHETADNLQASGAGGIGLFRTENLFLGRQFFPDEEEQFEIYKRAAEALAPKPVTIRTLDLGGDKNPHNSLYGFTEANPFMGYRAIRFCLDHPVVFKAQLRAILRASAHGNVRILYPMISNCKELKRANALLEECKNELRAEGLPFNQNLARGCMIEIPSAAVITDLLADHCEYFSVGTNDLVQYLLAVDRVNERVAHLYNPSQPAVLRSLSFIFAASHRKKKPVSVCGEMAADPVYVPLLLGLGADELSVSQSSVAEIKYLIRKLSKSTLDAIARELLEMTDGELIEKRLIEIYNQLVAEKK